MRSQPGGPSGSEAVGFDRNEASPGVPFTLVLSGGGLKGLAHIGVFRALEERGLTPSLVLGSSMGSLIAGAWAAGMRMRQMEDRALSLQRRDVFRIAHLDMALKRMLSPAVYRREPLDRILDDLVGDRTFRELEHRLVVNTADINTGNQILWGIDGLDDVRVADAVFASCALPGIFPPRSIRGHVCVDGAVIENFPVRAAAALGSGPVIAVNLGGGRAVRRGVERTGFASVYGRSLELVMNRMVEHVLGEWYAPALVVVRPRLHGVPMFAFNRTPFLIAEGYRATLEVLDGLPAPLAELAPGIHPPQRVELRVDPVRCIGCRFCALIRPELFRMREGKAEPVRQTQEWSPEVEGSTRLCPVAAITLEQSVAVPAEKPS